MSTASRDDNFVTTLLAVSSVDGVTPVTLYANPTTHRLLVDLAGGGSGTVQTVAIATANGFAGTSDGNASAPTLTITTSVTGILSGDGTAISAASTTGSGAVVLANTPTLITPVLGVATGTSIGLTSYLTVTPATDTIAGVFRRNSSGQTANIVEIQTEANGFLAGFNKSGDLTVPDEVYGAGWDGSFEVPTKNALYDKIETLGGATPASAYYFVAATDATTKEKALADYQCDGTADEVQINLALADVKNMGGRVILSSGTFNCAATVALIGETANSVSNPQIILWGSGIESTIINAASGVNGITITQEPKFDIGFLQINVAGTAHGILQTAGTERGNHQSHLHDINIITDFTTHDPAYWGIKMESPFRMRFSNIEMNGVANGMWLTSHTDSFNPGNLTGDRIFIDLWDNASVASAIGFKLSVLNSSSTGHFNLTSWNMVHIAGGSNLTTSTGIQLVGATGSYGEVRQHDFNNMNIEDVKTAVEMIDASDCSFTNMYYTRVLSGGTFFKLNSGSLNNWFENTYLDTNTGGATFVVIDDSGNDSAQPNVFNRLVGYSSGTTTLNGTLAASTVITNMALTEGGPTIDTDLTNRNNNITGNTITATTGIIPDANDGAYLGQGGTAFSDLFLAEGGVINWDNGDATLTQVGDVVTLAGADLKVTTPGNVSTSVVTTDATQTLTNKTLTSPTLTTPGAFTTGGTITLAENTSIALDPAGSADGKYSGITVTGTGGATIAFGELVYLAEADSRWELADADAEATAGYVMLGMAVTSSTDGAAITVLLQGIIRADSKFPALTIGKQVFVGETPGAIQVAIPTGADNVVRCVGFALTADEIYFNPSTDYQLVVA